MSQEQTEGLLTRHRKALNEYHRWDQKVKEMLKGRRLRDLTEEDRKKYNDISEQRDNAYNEMRRLERLLLDNIPGATTGTFKPITPEQIEQSKKDKKKSD